MVTETDSTETRRSTCEESRAVLDHEIEILNDIDDKAIWTVRTAVVVIGLVLSAAGVAGRRGVALSPGVTVTAGAGVVVLLCTMVSGILTYSISAPEPGISAQYRTAVWTARSRRPRGDANSAMDTTAGLPRCSA